MRTSRLITTCLGAATVLLLASACSSQQASDAQAPAVQATAGIVDYFDNNATGSNLLSISLTGYPDVTVGCTEKVGVNPVLIANTTSEPQTVYFTVPSELTNDVFWGPASEMAGWQGCPAYGGDVSQAPITIPAGQTWVGGIAAGGLLGPDTNLEGQQHNLEIGGGDNGQWYDFWLHLGINNGFDNWELNYSNTGGTDPSQNLQAGLFNVMECSPTSASPGDQIGITNTIVSNFTSNAPNAYTYNNNMPICFAFLNP